MKGIFFTAIWISFINLSSSYFNANITVNPGCKPVKDVPPCTDDVWLVHAKSGSHNEYVHYLWGTVGAPVLTLATTSLQNNSLIVNWIRLRDAENNRFSVEFETEPERMFIIAFPNLILFNDTKDDGKFDKYEDDSYVIPMENFHWTIANNNSNTITFVTDKYLDKPLAKGTAISLKITVFNEDGRSDEFPKLLTTPESSQFELALENLTIDICNQTAIGEHKKDSVKPICGFNQPRWAIQMVMLTDEDPQSKFEMSPKKSLDDEYSPGVFHLDEITTSEGRKTKGKGGYLQWRPISYKSRERDMNNSTYPNMSQLNNSLSLDYDFLNHSLVNAIFGDGVENLAVATTTVSFGQPKDGFYTETDYVMWVVSMGYGKPPQETFSLVIIIVIALGVGIPIVMFLIGGIALFVQKRKRSGRELLINN